MELELKFFASFREAVGQKTIQREYDGTSITVGEVLRQLESEFEGLEGDILDDDGDIRDMLTVLKNGREVVHLDGTATVLEDGDALSVFPPVAGG
ncbi:MAG: ubiquitin-like small modifier protein 1 [Haloarculaceae archaeon]